MFCPVEFQKPRPYFLIDRLFENELNVFPANVQVDEDVKGDLQDDIMLCFIQAAMYEDA